MIQGNQILLRAVNLDDEEYLFSLENNMEVWEISQTLIPFSRELIKDFISAAANDIYSSKQFRFIIEHIKKGIAIGTLDLFDFDPHNKRAGIGIIIDKEYRGKGIGKEAINICIEYCFGILDLHQLYCNILEENKNSLKLFQSCGFDIIGLKKDWIRWENKWHSEYLLQLINN